MARGFSTAQLATLDIRYVITCTQARAYQYQYLHFNLDAYTLHFRAPCNKYNEQTTSWYNYEIMR